MQDALSIELIERNPLAAIKAPKGGKVIQAQVWSAQEVKAFLETAKGTRLYAAFYLMLTRGLRIGETLALRCSDLEGDKLTVSRTFSMVENKPKLGPPKTERGYRTFYLSPDVLEVLEQRLEERMQECSIARSWQPNDLIFSSMTGTPMNHHNFRRVFHRLIEEAQVPRIRVHDMRHTYITLARDAGDDAEVIAHCVGQDVRVTMKVYSNVTEARKRKAAKSLKELLDDEE